MRLVFRFGTILSFLLFASIAGFSQTKEYKVRSSKSKILIDGIISKSEWRRSYKIRLKSDITGVKPNKSTFHKTRVSMLWDDLNLYIAAQLCEKDIQAHIKKHDGLLYSENIFSIFLDPDNDYKNYFEIEINALGTIFDLVLKKAQLRINEEDNVKDIDFILEKAVYLKGSINDGTDRDKYWSVELAIPWTELNLSTPEIGEEWSANFMRIHWKEFQASYWVWSPTGILFIHIPEKWGRLKFVD